MIKTKLIEDGAIYSLRLDNKINEFIKNENIKVIDIKFVSVVNGRLAVLIIYEEDDK